MEYRNLKNILKFKVKTQYSVTDDKLAMIFQEKFTYFEKEIVKKTTEEQEKELLHRIKAIISKELLIKSRLKHYISRYKEDKRPGHSFIEAFLIILDFNKVR